MSEPVLKIEKLRDDVKLPNKAYPTDSGFDLFVDSFKKHYVEIPESDEHYEIEGDLIHRTEFSIAPSERILIGTGIKATVGKGYEIQIRSRSGYALKTGLMIPNSIGTIDESYRGEIMISLINCSGSYKTIKLGDKIAQLVVCPVVLPEIQIVESLEDTERGEGGFGSTDVKQAVKKKSIEERIEALKKQAIELGVIGIKNFDNGNTVEEDLNEIEFCFNDIREKQKTMFEKYEKE